MAEKVIDSLANR